MKASMGQSVLRTFFNLVLIAVLPLSAKREGPHVNWTEYTDSPGNVSHFDYGQFTRVDICGGDKAHCLKTIKSEVRKASRKNNQNWKDDRIGVIIYSSTFKRNAVPNIIVARGISFELY
ncbi:uncharacterized protein LOC108252309 [Diaphorina citri]|uniref:Uncharacterized protein LOC108252309 n=1 Tax=Diaphorina citri TaxID=121845 RepID=A0A1S4EAS1_DIACI|nr:uncharacterized protein LOC108252309 [Diaphorina citri]